MSASQLTTSSFKFLSQLKKNNNREWFANHKTLYLRELEVFVSFADALLSELNKHDQIETQSGKKSLYRIYRDTRFSKEKTPYKTHWSGTFKRATKKLRGSYYFHVEPGNSFVGGGFWGPEPVDLKRIRHEIATDATELKKILTARPFKTIFGSLQGEKINTSPKGFDIKHPEINLLRHKQFLLIRSFSDEEVLAKGFIKEINNTYQKMRPFLDYMSEVLTTDVNGISLIE